MKIQTQQLLSSLAQMVQNHKAYAQQLQQLPLQKLNTRTSPESWSALECIEHLNLYSRFYNPEIQSRIANTTTTRNPMFKPGLLGDYFAKSMLPKEKLNKMKTFKSMNPIYQNLRANVLQEFITHQDEMLQYLQQAEVVNLNKVKTSISISKLIKLKLGDTLRVVINHQERHIQQAQRTLNA